MEVWRFGTGHGNHRERDKRHEEEAQLRHRYVLSLWIAAQVRLIINVFEWVKSESDARHTTLTFVIQPALSAEPAEFEGYADIK
jgi:hypothetical protein